MPQRIKRTADEWVIDETAQPTYQLIDNWDGQGPLQLDCDAEPDTRVADAECIGINFPAFSDGRALSLAVLLRTRLGYTGQIAALGATHEDIVHYLVRCGFDAIEIAPGRDAAQYLALIEPYSGHYQGSVTTPEPSFRRVSRGWSA